MKIFWLVIGLIIIVVLSSFIWVAPYISQLFSALAIEQMSRYVASFFPPDLSTSFLRQITNGTVETLAISALGTVLAAICGLLIALPASGRWGKWQQMIARLMLNFLRAVPELVWAALMVLAAGLGPFAGTLALTLHTSGVLGRLFAETLENSPREPVEALTQSGSPATLAFLYGTLPNVFPQLLAYTLYRWENNIRMAAILGFVGAGGLGQMLYFSLSLFQQQQAMTSIIAMLLLITLVDALSAWSRKRLVL